MNKALLMAAAMGLAGGALADKTTVNQPVSADVANVCTYGETWTSVAGNPPVSPSDGKPGNQTDVNGKTYTDGSTFSVTGGSSYRANGSASSSLGQTYVFRCTRGTPWTDNSGTKVITLRSGTDTLKVNVTLREAKAPDANNSGDVYTGSADFSIPAGQYSAAAGHYTGTLSIDISYN